MSDILVSVIVPVYNAEKYLRECIESIVTQKETSWQLILVDDGSMDSSPEICKEYAEKDKRILYVRQENAGVSAARNAGISYTEGKWLTFVDADDCLMDDALTIPIMFNDNSEMILCGYGDSHSELRFDERTIKLTSGEMKLSVLDIVSFKKSNPDTKMIGYYNHWSVWGRFFLTSVIKDNQILFDREIKLGEDLLFCVRYYNCIHTVMLNESRIYYYRPNETSVSRTFQKNRVENTVLLLEKLKKEVDENYEVAYQRFTVNRISKCCFDYYADKRCGLSAQEKVENLKAVCECDVIKHALEKAPFTRLTPGKKATVLSAVLLVFLKNKNYRQAIKFCERVKSKGLV